MFLNIIFALFVLMAVRIAWRINKEKGKKIIKKSGYNPPPDNLRRPDKPTPPPPPKKK